MQAWFSKKHYAWRLAHPESRIGEHNAVIIKDDSGAAVAATWIAERPPFTDGNMKRFDDWQPVANTRTGFTYLTDLVEVRHEGRVYARAMQLATDDHRSILETVTNYPLIMAAEQEAQKPSLTGSFARVVGRRVRETFFGVRTTAPGSRVLS